MRNQQKPIVFDVERIKTWLQGRTNKEAILLQTIELLNGEFVNKPISTINVHLKLESLLKPDPIFRWEEQ